MTGPGFHGDYDVMKTARKMVEEAKDSLGTHASFRENAALDSAIPSVSGDKVPIAIPGSMGPDIDQMETLIAQSVRGAYALAVDAVDGFLKETTKQLDELSRDISESIQEYRRRDEEAESGLPSTDYPR